MSVKKLSAAEALKSKFEEKTMEFTIRVASAGEALKRDNGYVPYINFLYAVNEETGALLDGYFTLLWTIKRKNLFGCKYGYSFKKGKMYRVLVRKCIGEESKEIPPAYRASSFYLLVGVLKKNVRDDRLYNAGRIENPLYDKKKKLAPVFLDNEIGHFTLEQFPYSSDFKGDVKYLNTTCSVEMDVELGKITADLPLIKLKEIFSDLSRWDESIRSYVAAELTELANDWRDESKTQVITEEEFAKRIEVGTIAIHTDGSMEVTFTDDCMFGDHGIILYIDETGKMKNAEIFG